MERIPIEFLSLLYRGHKDKWNGTMSIYGVISHLNEDTNGKDY